MHVYIVPQGSRDLQCPTLPIRTHASRLRNLFSTGPAAVPPGPARPKACRRLRCCPRYWHHVNHWASAMARASVIKNDLRPLQQLRDGKSPMTWGNN